MKSTGPILALNAVLIAALACTIGQSPAANQAASGEPDLPATITAQALTLQAPTQTPGPPTLTPTPAFTNTPTVPQVSVSSPSNCRTGPYIFFDLLWTMQPGQTAEVIAKNTSTNTWVIKYPGGQCWLYGAYATVSGNTAAIPEWPVPATPTPSKPAAPTNVNANASCSPIPATLTFAVHVTLNWVDQATNEEGYHIYRNGSLLATLGPNSSSFEDDTTLPVAPAVLPPQPGPKITYGVEAFNGDETSATKEREVNCD
jgi:hypothetical protein